jgi:hypothetical protein
MLISCMWLYMMLDLAQIEGFDWVKGAGTFGNPSHDVEI